MLISNQYDDHLAARLLDFFAYNTSWPRRLWDVGTILALREALEASDAAEEGALSTKAFRNVCHSTEISVGRDAGIGTDEERRLLQACLRGEMKAGGHDCRVLAQLVQAVEPEYLSRWSRIVASDRRPGAERAARAIAGHLLDRGISSTRLHKWWTFKLQHENGQRSMAELLQDAAEQLANRGPETFEVLVAFAAAPRSGQAMPKEWLDAVAVADWLKAQQIDTTNVRQGGGLLLSVPAPDRWAAVEKAAEMVSGLVTRLAVGAHSRLITLPDAWVKGFTDAVRLQGSRRGVEIGSLDRESNLYVVPTGSELDAALELLAPLDEGPPGPAVSGAWAAIEALLVGPGDAAERVVAADRLASLIACSLPRAELTTLAYKHQATSDDSLANRLKVCATNRDRAEAISHAIEEGTPLAISDATDIAAASRLKLILESPKAQLLDIQSHVAVSLRRLYRQRNLVLHWGKTHAVALRPALRAAAPLVGAGIDRIAHDWFVNHTNPLELAARARIRLELLGTESGTLVVDLLEPPR